MQIRRSAGAAAGQGTWRPKPERSDAAFHLSLPITGALPAAIQKTISVILELTLQFEVVTSCDCKTKLAVAMIGARQLWSLTAAARRSACESHEKSEKSKQFMQHA
jgi:hypothetical protein